MEDFSVLRELGNKLADVMIVKVCTQKAADYFKIFYDIHGSLVDLDDFVKKSGNVFDRYQKELFDNVKQEAGKMSNDLSNIDQVKDAVKEIVFKAAFDITTETLRQIVVAMNPSEKQIPLTIFTMHYATKVKELDSGKVYPFEYSESGLHSIDIGEVDKLLPLQMFSKFHVAEWKQFN